MHGEKKARGCRWYTCVADGEVLISESPRRLNLRLRCTTKTPVRDMLDVWPASLLDHFGGRFTETEGVDNIIAALEQTDRVYTIYFVHNIQLLQNFTAPGPFSKLVDLHLSQSSTKKPTILLDSFLGGSTPQLRFIRLDRIIFINLPRLVAYCLPHTSSRFTSLILRISDTFDPSKCSLSSPR